MWEERVHTVPLTERTFGTPSRTPLFVRRGRGVPMVIRRLQEGGEGHGGSGGTGSRGIRWER
eukprot:803332-Pleurochrysis_carterae.AAC.1